jgi:hypothetical protein
MLTSCSFFVFVTEEFPGEPSPGLKHGISRLCYDTQFGGRTLESLYENKGDIKVQETAVNLPSTAIS